MVVVSAAADTRKKEVVVVEEDTGKDACEDSSKRGAHSNTLQQTATNCNTLHETLHHTATPCYTLPPVEEELFLQEKHCLE